MGKTRQIEDDKNEGSDLASRSRIPLWQPRMWLILMGPKDAVEIETPPFLCIWLFPLFFSSHVQEIKCLREDI